MAASLSDRMCEHIAGLRFEDLPPATVVAAKHVLLDASGVMLGASGLVQEAEPFIALATAMGPGPATILGTGVQVSPVMAAFANGALAHALDFEDAFDRAPGHPNASLVPALLALAQGFGPVSGRRFLTALAVGGDFACRMGLALRQPMEFGGWYPPPILAAFGAVAGAANLLGLSAAQTRDALSLVLCQVTMPGEIKHSRGTVIRAVREAFPAQAAVQSALLARAGVTGFEEPLEGNAGFFALYAGGQFDPDDLTRQVGEVFWIEHLTFKPWPTCRGTHPFIEMAIALREQFDVDEVAAIEVGIDEVQTMLTEPIARKRAPETVIDAKFSIPFCVALALKDGFIGLESITATRLRNPELLALTDKVTAVRAVAPPWQRGAGGTMRVTLRDGQTFDAALDDALGCAARPLTEAALVDKFIGCAGRARIPLDAVRARALADQILALESCADVGALFA